MGVATLERIRADFDRIARLEAQRPERPDPYDAFLLSQIPSSCASVLEVGCGAGRLSRAVALRGAAVTAIDASAGMIELARARSGVDSSIRFVCDDFMLAPLAEGSFDCVFSVAMLHHVPLQAGLSRMKRLVGPSGTLVLHDVRSPHGPIDWIRSGVGAFMSADGWRWIGRRLHQAGDLRSAWHEHGAQERYLNVREVQAACAELLPGARVVSHPLWRYTVVWKRAA